MKRLVLPDRPDWQDRADAVGFIYHTPKGEDYWRDEACYQFTLAQVEDDLEDPAERLHQMCLEVVDHAVGHPDTMRRLAIPDQYHDWIKQSWIDKDPSLYGRFDFRYDGQGPAKLYEYNGDTPTAVFEAAVFQWMWLENRIERGELAPGTDQFNSLHEALIERFPAVTDETRLLHFTSVDDGNEDRATTLYMEDCARQAGLETRWVDIEEIGIDAKNRYADHQSDVIEQIFKLYPWEFMHRELFGAQLPLSTTRWIEPPWKAILSNKGLLPLLWEGWPGHENLLPTYFGREHPDLDEPFIRKPLFSREGANIEVVGDHNDPINSPDYGYGEEGYVCQAYAPPPCFDGQYPVLGVWIVGDEARGMGVRERETVITDDDARFVTNVIVD